MKYLILTLACAFSSTLLSAQTVLYVEPQAQDGGDGSVEKPYVWTMHFNIFQDYQQRQIQPIFNSLQGHIT